MRGAVTALKEDYDLTVGINGVLEGDLPIGGLSSSVAVLTAYLMALCDVNDIELSKLDLIQYNSAAERNFMGLKNGIFDHFDEQTKFARHSLTHLTANRSKIKTLKFFRGISRKRGIYIVR